MLVFETRGLNKHKFCCQVWSRGGGGYWEKNHDTPSRAIERGSERENERAQKRQLSFCNGTVCGGWLTTRRTGCLEHHGNREREGLREAEVQGLHLFQQHFNYFGRRRLVKQMHSGAPATTGRNLQRFWCFEFFLFNLSPLLYSRN